MSIFKRLRLDEVITSLPELGPTIPDGGYSWIVLFGAMIVQMTVPSVLSMYGIALGHLVSGDRIKLDFDVWNEKITMTPILMTAFFSLADPWTRTIVNLAAVPRLVALIGSALLSIGVLASGYLATGGVGAYLASLSAGAIMGIGASFVLLQSEKVIQKHFRTKLPLVRTLLNVAFSLGLALAPLVALALFTRFGIQTGLMAIVVLFLPTAFATGFLKSPEKRKSSSYTFLFNEEEAEIPIKMMEKSRNQADNPLPIDKNIGTSQELFAAGSSAYSYEDSEDIKLFVSSSNQFRFKWKEDLKVLKLIKFWVVMVACVGTEAGMMIFWLLLPPLVIIKVPSTNLVGGVTLSMIGGIGTLVAAFISLWNSNTGKKFIFGFSNCICSLVLLGLSYEDSYNLFIVLALFGGMSVGGLVISKEFTVRDALGTLADSKARAILSTCVGIVILLLCFIDDMLVCLKIVGVIQFLGGIYWILFPLLRVMRTRFK